MHNITSHNGNANQNHRDTTLYLLGQLQANKKKQKITSVSMDMEKLEPCTLLWEMSNDVAAMDNGMVVLPKN